AFFFSFFWLFLSRSTARPPSTLMLTLAPLSMLLVRTVPPSALLFARLLFRLLSRYCRFPFGALIPPVIGLTLTGVFPVSLGLLSFRSDPLLTRFLDSFL